MICNGFTADIFWRSLYKRCKPIGVFNPLPLSDIIQFQFFYYTNNLSLPVINSKFFKLFCSFLITSADMSDPLLVQ